MPSAARRCGARAVISRFSRNTPPRSGGRAPAIRLKTVVLPEPFGPRSPRISPARTVNESSLTARSPPNVLVRPRASSRSLLAGTPGRRRVDQRHAAEVLRPHQLLFAGLPLHEDRGYDPGAVRPE